jgi:hypothetical protein
MPTCYYGSGCGVGDSSCFGWLAAAPARVSPGLVWVMGARVACSSLRVHEALEEEDSLSGHLCFRFVLESVVVLSASSLQHRARGSGSLASPAFSAVNTHPINGC